MTDKHLEATRRILNAEHDGLIDPCDMGKASHTLLAEVDRLREGLEQIKQHGRVCPEFEICGHPWCGDSASAWLIADALLNSRSVEEKAAQPRQIFQEQLQAAVQQERKACAAIADARIVDRPDVLQTNDDYYWDGHRDAARLIATAIRQRDKTLNSD